MRSRKSNKYGTNQNSIDTILSLVFGCIGWILLSIIMVQSIMSKGTLPAMMGYLFIVDIVLALWGAFFAVMSWREEDGSLMVKRVTVLINFLLVIVVGAVIGTYLF